jgi:hypothetical protein
MRNSNNDQFKTPYRFFEEQRAEILAATSEKQPISFMERFSNRKTIVHSLAIAASLSGIVILSTVWINNSNNQCDSFACLLESTDFNDLGQEDYKALEDCCSFKR